MKNLFATLVLGSIVAGIVYVGYLLVYHVSFSMQPKDFEKELNTHFRTMLAEFDDRMYYGGLQILSAEPFECSEFLSCTSSEIAIGWYDTPELKIRFLNNQIFVNDLSDSRLSLRFATSVSPQIEMRNLSAAQREEIARIRSILPTQITCDFSTYTYGAQSRIEKDGSCEIATASAFYHLALNMSSSNPVFAQTNIPIMLHNHKARERAYQFALSIHSASLHITSNGLNDRIFELFSHSRLGKMLSREAYESAYPAAIPLALQSLATADSQETLSELASAVVQILRGESKNLSLSLQQKDKGFFFGEAEIEEFGYLFTENPKQLVRQIMQNYDVKVESY